MANLTKRLPGRPRRFKSPKEFLDAAESYYEWCRENPIEKYEVLKGGPNAGEVVVCPITRPLTWEGFCIHAGITKQGMTEYGRRDEYLDVFTHVRETIRTQKLEGAAAGIYNANIVARDLGLRDKSEVRVQQLEDLIAEDIEDDG